MTDLRGACAALLFAAALVPLSGCAATPMVPEAGSPACADAADEAAMGACVKAHWKRSEDALQRSYQQLRQGLGSGDAHQRLLEKSQQAWLAYRDAECAQRTVDSQGGTAFQQYRLNCLAELDDLRRADLDRQASAP